jgi:hypothetical protein
MKVAGHFASLPAEFDCFLNEVVRGMPKIGRLPGVFISTQAKGTRNVEIAGVRPDICPPPSIPLWSAVPASCRTCQARP